MLLEKWSTSYLSSAALKHNPHRAKLQITATNSLGSIAPRFRGGRGAPGGAGQGRAGPGGATPALRDGRAHPALTSPPIPGRNRGAPGLGTRHRRPRHTQPQLTEPPAPMSSAQMHHEPKTCCLFPQDSPCIVRNSYILQKMMMI